MSLIVKKSDWQRWLEPGDQQHPPLDLLRPFDSEPMKAWRIDTKINKVDSTELELSEPLRRSVNMYPEILSMLQNS